MVEVPFKTKINVHCIMLEILMCPEKQQLFERKVGIDNCKMKSVIKLINPYVP
jgi:hypothetical protein